MRTCLIFFTLISVLRAPLTAQVTYADSLRLEGELEAAIEAYESLLTEDPENSDLRYNLACTYALQWRNDSAFEELEQALAKDSSLYVLTDPDLLGLTADSARWEAMERTQWAKYEAKNGPVARPELARALLRMRMHDQAYYYHLEVAEQKLGRQSPVTRALWDLKSRINEDNKQRLLAILAEDGWPKRSEVGGSAAGAAFLVIQHADLATQKKYIGMLKEACEAGEARWSGYALMYDRIEMREGRPQLYGSQVRQNPETEALEPHPILEPEKVNERRAEMGMEPLEDYLARFGIRWEGTEK